MNYSRPDMDRVIRTDIMAEVYQDGLLKIKVFQIQSQKKYKKVTKKNIDER